MDKSTEDHIDRVLEVALRATDAGTMTHTVVLMPLLAELHRSGVLSRVQIMRIRDSALADIDMLMRADPENRAYPHARSDLQALFERVLERISND
ncbi:MAG: hypothetical protein AAF415_13055 [Pseudomonadota bacterium]